MDRRTFSTSLAAGVAGSVLGVSNQARAAVSARRIVFLHGLFADGSCWSEVIDRLQPLGFRITSVQNPLRSFEDDVATARRALRAQDGPTVLVAHSYSGMIACQVGIDPNVSALVFVAARAPDADEDYTALAAKYPSPPASAGIVTSDGFSQLTERAFLADFANGVEPAKARELYAVQQPCAATLTKTAKTIMVRRLEARSDDQSGLGTLYGGAHEGDDDRARLRSPVSGKPCAGSRDAHFASSRT
jgi:pimeloyl-ACP methyl ester carboxylesterase